MIWRSIFTIMWMSNTGMTKKPMSLFLIGHIWAIGNSFTYSGLLILSCIYTTHMQAMPKIRCTRSWIIFMSTAWFMLMITMRLFQLPISKLMMCASDSTQRASCLPFQLAFCQMNSWLDRMLPWPIASRQKFWLRRGLPLKNKLITLLQRLGLLRKMSLTFLWTSMVMSTTGMITGRWSGSTQPLKSIIYKVRSSCTITPMMSEPFNGMPRFMHLHPWWKALICLWWKHSATAWLGSPMMSTMARMN